MAVQRLAVLRDCHACVAAEVRQGLVALQVQFHGVALLHALRAGDRLAISKLVTSLTQKNVRSSLAQVLLVRYGCL